MIFSFMLAEQGMQQQLLLGWPSPGSTLLTWGPKLPTTNALSLPHAQQQELGYEHLLGLKQPHPSNHTHHPSQATPAPQHSTHNPHHLWLPRRTGGLLPRALVLAAQPNHPYTFKWSTTSGTWVHTSPSISLAIAPPLPEGWPEPLNG